MGWNLSIIIHAYMYKILNFIPVTTTTGNGPYKKFF